MATFKLDDQEIPFEPGETIIQAAARAGIEIPHYCWHPGLSVAANCRMCLVEMLPPPGRKALMLDVVRFDEATQTYVKEQKPKLVPACQQTVTQGMEIRSETSSYVEKARASVQEFLLLNHPVDCPICDQAGECKLQDYWLEHSRQQKRMRDEPVHKPKAVEFGPTIVYDGERCIACTRCIRFCDEVAKDPVLSLRQRGNLNEITVAPGRRLDHAYTLMTENVCPVGALTAKDFRFKARVWFLRSVNSICTGCATGCNSETDFDPRNQQVYRFRPRFNPSVNQYWMCDEGMLSYLRITEGRISSARIDGERTSLTAAIERVSSTLKGADGKLVDGKQIAVLLGAGFSLEDNYALLWLARRLGVESFFETGLPPGQGDDILRNADKNPNSAGVRRLLEKEPESAEALTDGLRSGRFTHVIALGSTLKDSSQEPWFSSLKKNLVVLASHEGPLANSASVFLPVAVPAEMSGHYVNAAGLVQLSEQAVRPSGDALPAHRMLLKIIEGLGLSTPWKTGPDLRSLLFIDSAPVTLESTTSTNANTGVVTP
ncbi:MAG: 2Fe-2S iron-sulfur cluster-binding protein [Polyangiaceae bacterium]